MSDAKITTFTPEQISAQAQANVTALSLAAVAYMKEHTLSPDEFWSFVGHQFAQVWEGIETAEELAMSTALNMVSAGGVLQSLSGDETTAMAVIGRWPPEGSLALFDLSQDEADTVWGIFQPIVESLGYDYQWHRVGDNVEMTIALKK